MRSILREDHRLFQEQVRRFIARAILPFYETWEQNGITPRSLWEQAGAEGLLNCALPEPYGAGGDFGHAAIVIEELARANCLGIGFSIHSDMVAPYLLHHGTPAQQDRWLPAMAQGSAIGALALTEPDAGSDLKAIRTRARPDGVGGYIIQGQKAYITNGVNADVIVMAASTEPDLGARGLSLFCIDSTVAGLHKGPALRKIGQHAQDTCELFFDDVHVPAEALLGEANAAFSYLAHHLAQERLAIALRAAASAEGMLSQTVDYVRERKAFGRRIIDYQNTRFKLADCVARTRMLRAFLDECLMRHMDGQLDASSAAMAKLNATEIQGQVLDELLQMHGGYGYMSEGGIGRAWVDARALRIFGGTSEILREIIGKDL